MEVDVTIRDLLQLLLEPPLTLDEINTTMMILPAVVEAGAVETVVGATLTKMQIEDLEAVPKSEWVSFVVLYGFSYLNRPHFIFQCFYFQIK